MFLNIILTKIDLVKRGLGFDNTMYELCKEVEETTNNLLMIELEQFN